MESPRELKRRLASIRTTGQLAGAMRTVASARYSRLSALSGPYAEYVKALERLEIEANEALVIEDSRVGVMAAHAAGIEAAVVREPFSEASRQWLMAEVDWYFENFAQLADAID